MIGACRAFSSCSPHRPTERPISCGLPTRLGVEVVVGSDEMPILMEGATERAVVVPLDEPEVAADLIVALDDRRGVDAVVAVDDRGVLVAAAAGERLGFPHNPPDAVAATRDKAAMRRALGAGRGAPARVRRGRARTARRCELPWWCSSRSTARGARV